MAQQSGISIVVAPTLIELSVKPGEIWRSNLKVVNTNTFPLTLYTDSAHFAPTGEYGQGDIVHKAEIPQDEAVLANWVSVETPTVTIPAGGSFNIPFVVETPADAPPGSHFATLQVSTVPSDTRGEIGVSTAQEISSLLFVRVEGDITEDASIRSFTASNSYRTTPKTDLQLRFENKGNVHLRPVGEITIKNMWGSERGRIPVNVNTSFGNALPETIRSYDFSWQREPSLFDIGYYTAEVVVSFGTEKKQFAAAKTGFLVIPVKPMLIAALIVASIIGFIILVSRWYITRLLAQAGVTSLKNLQDGRPATATRQTQRSSDLVVGGQSAASATGTKRGLVHYLISVVTATTALTAQSISLAMSVWKLMTRRARYVFVGLCVLVLVVVLMGLLWSLRQNSTGYQATIGQLSATETFNGEEISFFQQPGMSQASLTTDADWYVDIYNATRTSGAAGALAARLAESFPVRTLDTAPEVREKTVILFPSNLQAEAVALSEAISGALLSATGEVGDTVVVYIGNR